MKMGKAATASVLAIAVATALSAVGGEAAFSQVKYRATGETSFEVCVWGRTYRYDNSVFPVSVKTAGREIFAAPMSPHAKFGDVEGDFHDWQYTLFSTKPDETVVVAAAHCSNVMVNASITFEPDGLARTELKIVPYGYMSLHNVRDYEPDLSALWFDIDLKSESSTLFHYWPYSENSCVVTADVNSGETKTREHPFRAYTWCGWEDGGFSVTCESAEGFELDDEKKCISVTRTDGGTRVRYRLLDHAPAAWKGRRDRWGDALMPLCWEFGLQATPVKARSVGDPDVYRRIHIYEVDKANVLGSDIAERLGADGALHPTFPIYAVRNLVKSLISRKQGRGTFVTGQGESCKIGLILSGSVNQALFSPIVAAIVSEAEKQGCELVFGNQNAGSPYELVQKTKVFAARLVAERVSGVIYHPIGGVKNAKANRTILDLFKIASIPVVLLGCDIDMSPKRSEYDVVGINNSDAGYRIASHLIERGARRICFLMRAHAATSVRDRLSGVEAAVRNSKNRCRCWVVESVNPSAEALKRIWRKERPDALICGNDGMVPAVRQVIEQMRLRVPDDVMLAAFDDLQLASMQSPALTTVHQPCAEIGTAVFKRMIARLKNRDEAVREIYMRVDLAVRESTRRKI